MKNISFLYTTQQILDESKTETIRRNGNYNPGEIYCAVEKTRGIKKGEKINRLKYIQIKDVIPIKINQLYFTKRNTRAEGFPGMNPVDFIDDILIGKCKFKIDDRAFRIKFKYVVKIISCNNS